MKNSQQSLAESAIQSKCVKWFWNEYPDLRRMFFAVTNNSVNEIQGAFNRALGVVPGVSDTILLYNGSVYLIEFKTDTGSQSKDQLAWESKVTAHNFEYKIIKSLEEFQRYIKTQINQE